MAKTLQKRGVFVRSQQEIEETIADHSSHSELQFFPKEQPLSKSRYAVSPVNHPESLFEGDLLGCKT
jgi:hypothetical protein